VEWRGKRGNLKRRLAGWMKANWDEEEGGGEEEMWPRENSPSLTSPREMVSKGSTGRARGGEAVEASHVTWIFFFSLVIAIFIQTDRYKK